MFSQILKFPNPVIERRPLHLQGILLQERKLELRDSKDFIMDNIYIMHTSALCTRVRLCLYLWRMFPKKESLKRQSCIVWDDLYNSIVFALFFIILCMGRKYFKIWDIDLAITFELSFSCKKFLNSICFKLLYVP